MYFFLQDLQHCHSFMHVKLSLCLRYAQIKFLWLCINWYETTVNPESVLITKQYLILFNISLIKSLTKWGFGRNMSSWVVKLITSLYPENNNVINNNNRELHTWPFYVLNLILLQLSGGLKEQVLLHGGQRHHAGLHVRRHPHVGRRGQPEEPFPHPFHHLPRA